MPWVTVGPPPRLSGKPTVSTLSPSRSPAERPSAIGTRSLSLTWMIARSRFSAVPMTVARTGFLCRPSPNETVSVRAPRTTWKFVTITPALVDHDARGLALVAVEADRAHVDDGRHHLRDDIRHARRRRRGRRAGQQAEREHDAEDDRRAPHGSRWPQSSDAAPAPSANSAASPTRMKLSSRHSFLCPSREARSV